jgi:hypothetical protein
MEIDMIGNSLVAEATRKVKNREVVYTWRSKDKSIEFDGEVVGGLVRLTIWHSADDKTFKSSVRFMHWDDRNGYTVESFTIFDNVNFPSASLISKSVARYSDKALAQFEGEVLGQFGIGENQVLKNLWRRATEIAMGGDGTHRYSEVA